MAEIIRGFFAGPKSSASPVASADVDADFADFADAPSPTPVPGASSTSALNSAKTVAPSSSIADKPYTKWYNIHERTSLSDFYLEMFAIPLLIVLAYTYLWGSRKNRGIAKRWIEAHAPALEAEYAVVGFGRGSTTSTTDASEVNLDGLLREKSKHLYLSYATGRQNVAFMDIKMQLHKRYSPFALLTENVLGFFVESFATSGEKMELTAYTFDGKEEQYLSHKIDGGAEKKQPQSAYDGFVWAIVHKDAMKRLRDDRFDLSITTTRENPKLPAWASVMSESAEITDTLLTTELVKAVEACDDDFEALIVTDLPVDAPKTLDDLAAKKRVSLSLRMTKDPQNARQIVQTYLRMPDQLVTKAHFRSEVTRRVRTTREETANKIRKSGEEAKAEERKLEADKAKKEERDRKLKGMKPDEQRKFLDREREKESKKRQSKRTIKG